MVEMLNMVNLCQLWKCRPYKRLSLLDCVDRFHLSDKLFVLVKDGAFVERAGGLDDDCFCIDIYATCIGTYPYSESEKLANRTEYWSICGWISGQQWLCERDFHQLLQLALSLVVITPSAQNSIDLKLIDLCCDQNKTKWILFIISWNMLNYIKGGLAPFHLHFWYLGLKPQFVPVNTSHYRTF